MKRTVRTTCIESFSHKNSNKVYSNRETTANVNDYTF